VTEKTRAAKSSNYKELIGHYNPHTNEVKVDAERVQYWIGAGAQVSDTVHNLFVREGLIKGEKKNVLPKKTPIVKEKEETEEKAEAAEAPVEEVKEEKAEEAKENDTPTEVSDEEKATEDK